MDQNEQTKNPTHHRQKLHLSLIFFCFVSGFLGAGAFLGTGLVRPEHTQIVNKNQEKIVAAEGEIMASIAKKVGPSVVSVTTESVSDLGVGSIISESAGTGIIISPDGYIITNKHVIRNAQEINVVTNNGVIYRDIETIGSDPLNDIAFLKIKSDKKDFSAARLGDSRNVEVGQKVVSIGNALGQFQNSVTSGIISGRGRPILAQDGQNGEQLDNLFQTDAAINPGNSGGPLLNLSGEVIGINTAIAQDAQGIGFSIPINAAKGPISTVLAGNGVKKSYLGVQYVNITQQVAETFNLSVSQGAYVYASSGSGVVGGSPADKAGLQNKDIITKVNDQAVDENNGLALLLAAFKPNDTIKLTVLRDGTTKIIDVTLGEYSAP